jgi:anti-anti-sigma factor
VFAARRSPLTFTAHPKLSLVASTVLELRGEIDFGSADGWRDIIVRCVTEMHPEVLVLDLSGVSFTDSAGVALLLFAKQRCNQAGVELELRNVARQVMRVLDMTGVRAILGLEDTES